MLTRNHIRKLLLEECRRAGSAKAWAEEKDLAFSDVCAVGAGKQRPKPGLLAALGYFRPEVYAEIGAWAEDEPPDDGWGRWMEERRGKKRKPKKDPYVGMKFEDV